MAENQRYRYEAVFEKSGDMVFISHLDLMTLFRRAIRRADLPFVLTEGFTPRVRISVPAALKLGRESRDEKMSLWLERDMDAGEVKRSINEQLPAGVRIIKMERNIYHGKKTG